MRTELLKTVTTVANQLLRSTDYTIVLPDVLQILGEAVNADRCSLVQNITAPHSGKPAIQIQAEWCRPGIQATVMCTPELVSALLWEEFSELYDRLQSGETVQFFGTNLSEAARDLSEAQGNTAMIMVPIVVQGQFWGVFGFDYCGEVRSCDDLDCAIVAIAVDSIAAAIERQMRDDALRNALREMESREQWLEATASAANVTLAIRDMDEAINAALRVIGEGINADRVEIFQHIYDFTRGRLETVCKEDIKHSCMFSFDGYCRGDAALIESSPHKSYPDDFQVILHSLDTALWHCLTTQRFARQSIVTTQHESLLSAEGV